MKLLTSSQAMGLATLDILKIISHAKTRVKHNSAKCYFCFHITKCHSDITPLRLWQWGILSKNNSKYYSDFFPYMYVCIYVSMYVHTQNIVKFLMRGVLWLEDVHWSLLYLTDFISWCHCQCNNLQLLSVSNEEWVENVVGYGEKRFEVSDMSYTMIQNHMPGAHKKTSDMTEYCMQYTVNKIELRIKSMFWRDAVHCPDSHSQKTLWLFMLPSWFLSFILFYAAWQHFFIIDTVVEYINVTFIPFENFKWLHFYKF